MRILIIGGTGFAGSHQVHAALARGHNVTTFTRSALRKDFPPEVEVVAGDRFGDLKTLKNQDWDAVIDNAAFAPLAVRALGQALKDRVRHYTLISTVMTYARDSGRIDEHSAILEYKEPVDPYTLKLPSGWPEYGSLKILCEREAEAMFSGKTLVVRPGVISGPGDTVDHIAYWFARMARGGEVLAPGEPAAPVQFIDARDLAQWVVRMAEGGETGCYNAVGPSVPMGMAELLGAVQRLFSTDTCLTWVPSRWLIEQKLKADQAPFFWLKDPELAEYDELWLSYKVSSKKAQAMGLSFRPMSATLSDNLEWYQSLPAERQALPASGWNSELEQRLLMNWHAHSSLRFV